MQGDASQGEELVRVSGGSCAARTRTLLHKAEGGGGHGLLGAGSGTHNGWGFTNSELDKASNLNVAEQGP